MRADRVCDLRPSPVRRRPAASPQRHCAAHAPRAARHPFRGTYRMSHQGSPPPGGPFHVEPAPPSPRVSRGTSSTKPACLTWNQRGPPSCFMWDQGCSPACFTWNRGVTRLLHAEPMEPARLLHVELDPPARLVTVNQRVEPAQPHSVPERTFRRTATGGEVEGVEARGRATCTGLTRAPSARASPCRRERLAQRLARFALVAIGGVRSVSRTTRTTRVDSPPAVTSTTSRSPPPHRSSST